MQQQHQERRRVRIRDCIMVDAPCRRVACATGAHLEREAVARAITRTRWPARSGWPRAHLPALAVDLAQPSPSPNSMHLAGGADQRARAADDRPPARLRAMPRDAIRTKAAETSASADDQRQRDAEARQLAVDQQHARRRRTRRRRRRRARRSCGTKASATMKHDAEQDQRQPGVVDRQHLQRESAEQQADRADHARQRRSPGSMNSNSRP